MDHLAAQLENASQGLEICIAVDAEAADVQQLLSGDPAALRRKGVVWALEPAGLREAGLAVVATTLASGDHLWLLDESAALPAPGALGTISRLVSLVPHATGAAFSAATGLEPGTTEVLRGPEAEQASAGRDQVVLREAWMLALAEFGGTAALASTPGGAARIRAAMAQRRPVWARVTAALRSPTPAATGPRRHRLRRPAQPPEPPVTPAGAASPALRPPIGATGHPARGELAAVWTAPTHDTVVRGNVLGAGLAIASRLGLAAAEFVEGTNPEHAVAAARTTGVLVIPLIEQVLAHPTDIAELFETADREGWRLVIGDFGADSHAAGGSRIADYFAELAAVTEAGCGPLPSRALRARVSTGGDQTYRRSGLLHTRAFSDALRAAGCRLEATDTLLEWGAGCGRMTTHLLALAPQAAVTGVDPDPDTIAWVRDHLPATALATAIDPPLPLADDAFDLVIGHSVFSHLAADAQDRWLAELARVIRPGGHAAVTVNGPIGLDWHLRHPLAKMPAAFEALTRRDGISFWRGEGWEETFDDGYHTTFHAPAYIREHCSRSSLSPRAPAPRSRTSSSCVCQEGDGPARRRSDTGPAPRRRAIRPARDARMLRVTRREDEIAEAALAGAIEANTDVGPMLVHGHDPFITPTLMRSGTWEPQLRDAIVAELRPGMSAADIGANIGYFVRVMSSAVGPRGQVMAVEPDPGNLALLRRNVERPPGAPISVVAAAAWDTPGSVSLTRCEDNTGDHRIAVLAAEREVVTVDTVVLDDLLPDGVDLLLLDTQGVEHIVLRGAARLLHGPRRPVVFAEFWPAGLQEAGADPLDVLREYRAAGLSIRVVEAPGSELPDDATPERLLEAILAIEPEQFGTLRLQAQPHRRWDRLRERGAGEWATRHPAPEQPWTLEYNDAHRALVSAAVTDDGFTSAVAAGRRVPRGYGVGFDERVIEYPWLFGTGISGRVLDAGSTFNHPHILNLALPLVTSLTITTLEPEQQSFPKRGVSYVFGDLRALPFRDGWFDTTVSLSTLEHVGMDNSVYGVKADRAADADREVALAAAELRRVTRPGGRILVTIPYGRSEDHGWFRQFAAADVQRLIAAFGPARSRTVIYRYTAQGWQRSSLRRASGAAYRDFTADPAPVADRAAAARAVACIALDV